MLCVKSGIKSKIETREKEQKNEGCCTSTVYDTVMDERMRDALLMKVANDEK